MIATRSPKTSHKCRRALAFLACLVVATAPVGSMAQGGPGAHILIVPAERDLAPIRSVMENAAAQMDQSVDTDPVAIALACDADGEALDAIPLESARAVSGIHCTELLNAIIARLDPATPVVTPLVGTERPFERAARGGRPVFSLATRQNGGDVALAAHLVQTWRGSAYALVDDGTIANRSRTDAIRLLAAERGPSPVLVETLRPGLENQDRLARRIRSSGATRVFVAAEDQDLLALARSALALGLEVAVTEEAMRVASDPAAYPDGMTVFGERMRSSVVERLSRDTQMSIRIAAELAVDPSRRVFDLDGTTIRFEEDHFLPQPELASFVLIGGIITPTEND